MMNQKINLSDADWIIEQFFERDGKLTPSGNSRQSVLLTAKRELFFLRGTRLDKYSLTKEQENAINSDLPVLAVVLLYCGVIDLIARVMKASMPKNGENARYFKDGAITYFKIPSDATDQLWRLRNSMSHQLHLGLSSRTVPFGFSDPCRYNKNDLLWEFNLNGFCGNVRKTIEKCHILIKNETPALRMKHVKFIYKHGFIYTH